MTIAIHQPNFIPWIGYFYKIAKVDIFVFLDDVQFSKNSFTNRNQIKTPNGEQWLTLPLVKPMNNDNNINQIEIFEAVKNKNKIIKTIESNYKKSENFNVLFPQIQEILLYEEANLAKYNIYAIKKIASILGIHNTKFILSSELKNHNLTSSEKLIDICIQNKSSKYLSGFGGKNYQDIDMFAKNDIELVYSTFQHPSYSQLWGEGFIKNLSILDYMLNENKTNSSNFFR